jgi:hypothetical protein
MEDNRVVVVDVALRPNDVYTPFLWSRGNLARWVTAIVLCLIFYDLYKSSRETILSFQGGESILAIMALLVLLVLFGLLLFPYLRVRAMFRNSPGMTKTRRYTLGTTGITMMQTAIANGLCSNRLLRPRASLSFREQHFTGPTFQRGVSLLPMTSHSFAI